jgi:hypothetical protein
MICSPFSARNINDQKNVIRVNIFRIIHLKLCVFLELFNSVKEITTQQSMTASRSPWPGTAQA